MNEMHGIKLIGIASTNKESLKNMSGRQGREAWTGGAFFKKEIAPLQNELNE